jgi:DNA-binding CsgD family transcriptional regulator
MYEISFNSSNSCLMVENLQTGETKTLNDMNYVFLKRVDDTIKLNYPDSYNKLSKLHGPEKEGLFARVRQFLACNFSTKDGFADIDEDWNFVFEHVTCPAKLTRLCTLGICEPEISHELTEREIEVLRLFARGFCEKEISDALFISKSTVHNHISNMYKKIGLVGKTSPDRKLVCYAHEKKIL